MRHIYILFSEIGWAWAVVVSVFLAWKGSGRAAEDTEDTEKNRS
jgi:hypothetical protein